VTLLEGTETQQLWSVTTLIKQGLGTGPGLLRWHKSQVAAAALDNQRTVDVMLAEQGREETIKWLVGKSYQRTEEAKIRGTDVHTAAEAIALGSTVPAIPGIEPYVQQYRQWLHAFKPRFLLAEAPVYNLSERYAGTCDGIMDICGRRVIFDYKTTDKGPDADSRHPYPEVALQLAAYARAEVLGVNSEQRYDRWKNRYYVYDPTLDHEPMPQVNGAICIVITPYDCFARAIRITDEVYNAFLDVLRAATWQLETSKSSIGPELIPPEAM
jgi:hypothetical protein